jgi:hypothetical protein
MPHTLRPHALSCQVQPCSASQAVLTSQNHNDPCFRQQGAHSGWHSWVKHVAWCDVSMVHGLRKLGSLQDHLCWGTSYGSSCIHILQPAAAVACARYCCRPRPRPRLILQQKPCCGHVRSNTCNISSHGVVSQSSLPAPVLTRSSAQCAAMLYTTSHWPDPIN